jgi:poly(hydroxyalkanoate) depolymerase family esterase
MRPNGFRLPRFPVALPLQWTGKGALKGGETPIELLERQDFGSNPGALRMFLYVPPSLPKKAPLVVVLHGCTQSATEYDLGAGWSELASRAGFAVLAPEQTRENNINGCFNWFQPGDVARGKGEAASIWQMIERAITLHDLDRGRVFISGLSAGGAMTAAMLGAYPEVFAGGAVIAGLPIGSAGNVLEALNSMRHASVRSPEEWRGRATGESGYAGPWPNLSVWHGDADATVHSSNAEALIVQWTGLHSVESPACDTQEGSHRRRVWRNKDGRVVVEALTLPGMGHGTPIDGASGIGRPGPYFLDVGISSTLEIAAFWRIMQQSTLCANGPDQHPKEKVSGTTVSAIIRRALHSARLLKP